MAIDTAAKRYSAINLGNPWRGVNAFPSGTVTVDQQIALLYLYSGFTIPEDIIPGLQPPEYVLGTMSLHGASVIGTLTAIGKGVDGRMSPTHAVLGLMRDAEGIEGEI